MPARREAAGASTDGISQIERESAPAADPSA